MKNILICVTGSIAVYKSCELVRLFVKNSFKVKVLMSSGAKKFINPLTFEALTKDVVLTDENESWVNNNNHIDIGKWADVIIVAPATANTINKLSNGIADNLLTQTILAYNKKIVIAPSANTNMLENNFTKASIKMLKLNNFIVVEPVVKRLACGDEGVGAMAEVRDIYFEALRAVYSDSFWENRKVVVSGGATIEKIDKVRYISNFSSGKMANGIVKALYILGAEVCFVYGKVDLLDIPIKVHKINIQSVDELDEYVNDCIKIAKKGVVTKATLLDSSTPTLIQKKPFYFSVSAISDYKVKYPQEVKLKKEDIGDSWSLELIKTRDILANINNEVYKIGFKAEFDKINGLNNAKKALKEKNLDLICLNYISKHDFGSDENSIVAISKNSIKEFNDIQKDKLSIELLKYIKNIL